MRPSEDRVMTEHYGQLVGCKIIGLAYSRVLGDTFFGLRVQGLARVGDKYVEATREVFIMCDPEGNGPGFLDISDPVPVPAKGGGK